MKLLLDQGLPRSAAVLLRNHGLDVDHVGERGLAAASDAVLVGLAAAEDRVIMTLDADFHAILALTHATKPSVVRIRIEGLRAEALTKLIQAIVAQVHDDLVVGAMVTVQDGRIRVRRLPSGA